MDKNTIKSFAVNSRRKLMEDVVYRMNLVGITSKSISEPISSADGFETYDIGGTTYRIFGNDVKRRKSLVREVQNKGFENVVEEVAYTWFNRIIAIRFMEVNDYLPTRTRVLSSETPGKIEPDIITEALDLDLNYTEEDKKEIVKLLDDNELDELFRFLFIKQCNKLNEILPGLFEKTDDYMELLIGISFTNKEGVIRRLIEDIPEEDFTNQVEIIGWLYQFYNVELKDKSFDDLKKKKIKIGKDKIPAVTQLFTPDWIVKYMVENSVGRLWLENHHNDELKSKWKYYVEDVEQEFEVEQQFISIKKEFKILSPEDIKIIDPCMGSGHILVYVFDVLMDIYISEGFNKNDASEAILKHNLFGLDIDDRAYQLSYFSLMMKARGYNRKIFDSNIIPLVSSFSESNSISDKTIDFILSNDNSVKNDLEYILKKFHNAKEYGSIIRVSAINFNRLKDSLLAIKKTTRTSLDFTQYSYEIDILLKIIVQAKYLNNSYSIVITNPPYMGKNSMTENLSSYLKDNYPDTKLDLFAVFIERCKKFLHKYGFCSMIAQHSFMFLSSYERLREDILNNTTIINLLHLGPHAFDEIGGEVVQTAAFVFRDKSISNFKSYYYDLLDFNSEKLKEDAFLNSSSDISYIFKQKDFNEIPGKTFAYWATEKTLNAFNNGKDINLFIDSFQGIITGNNAKFLRFWYELTVDNIAFDKHSFDDIDLNKTYWIPYNKGGKFRKWYGNQDYVVYWKNGPSDKTRGKASFSDYYLRDYVSWSYIASTTLSTRYFPKGFLWDVSGSGMFDKEDNLKYIQALLTSKVGINFLKVINPTLNFQVENILQVPIIMDNSCKDTIDSLVDENIKISKDDWDSFELSWNFKKHPFLFFNQELISNCFNSWKHYQEKNINKMLNNEILINDLLINVYDLEDELDSNLTISDITLYSPDYKSDIKSFISYAVGCMFGRYSLDEDGLQFAGDTFDMSKYHKFIPDDDNIIPVLDTEYFDDDIVGKFVEFVKCCFGEATLEENLNFIANALDSSNKSSKQKIRNYFLKDFFDDHVKMYSQPRNPCCIYWQFDSGENNAFKCLIYMHRYDPTIVARVRTDYLHKTQKAIEQNIERCDNIIVSESPEKTKAEKLKSKLIKQLDEIKEYDIVLAHIANQKIEIDLDDGVKVNYNMFQNIEIQKDSQRNKKVNLLKKM